MSGYLESYVPSDNTMSLLYHLIIDEYAASIVRKIFRLYLEGNGKAHIASILSSENILIPSLYKTRVLQQNYYNSKLKDTTKT